MSRPVAASFETLPSQPPLKRCRTRSGCPRTDCRHPKLVSAAPAGRRCPRSGRRRICVRARGGRVIHRSGANTRWIRSGRTVRDSGFRCKRFDGACITWVRRQSRPHTAYGCRIFLLRARLVDLRTGPPCGRVDSSVSASKGRVLSARCRGTGQHSQHLEFLTNQLPSAQL